jgi:hypothetical protein
VVTPPACNAYLGRPFLVGRTTRSTRESADQSFPPLPCILEHGVACHWQFSRGASHADLSDVVADNWWNAPRTWAKVQAIDPIASHASWMENFPWTRLADVAHPDEQKPMTDLDRLRQLGPTEVRAQLGDGNFGGRYQRPDADMQAIWDVAVAETRAVIDEGWLGVGDRG